ncbi:MAG: hypothetical protein RL754_952 [Bacteroidota bacterium]|jgi:hypothetical protein
MRFIPHMSLLALLLFGCGAPQKEPTLFEEVAISSGVQFRNDLVENEDQNIVDYLYFYNGAGVAVADFDLNGFEDLYFIRNNGPNALFWNKGNWQFEEGTDAAGMSGKADFQSGVSIVDFNGDGYPDVYISAVNYLNWSGYNELYRNNGDGTFTEVSAQYGLDLNGYGQQALFADFDNDGDVDLYLLRHSVHPSGSFNRASQRDNRDLMAGDRFFRNTGTPQEPVFEDQTQQSGILSSALGYGLSALTEDFNGDGYLDIYVANDFHENDYLYINNGGQGFTLSTSESFQTNSKFTMGSDATDFNNDGRPDLFTLDMKPWDEVERKNALGAEPFHIHKYKRTQGYVEQFPRNALHLWRGNLKTASGQIPVFEDWAPLLGAESTDWSWGVLMEDFDGDGATDIFVTNGIKRRPNDLDYIQFLSGGGGAAATDAQIYGKMPPGQCANRAFKQQLVDGDNPSLKETSASWGLDYVGTSNGSAVADFDNDGRLDIVVNNLDGPALLYRNTLGTPQTLVDPGTVVRYKKRTDAPWQTNHGVRSWLSYSTHKFSAESFGGSVIIQWPDGSEEAFTLFPGETNTLVPGSGIALEPTTTNNPVFPIPDTLIARHVENTYTSFVKTPLLLEGIDEMGPAAAWFDDALFLGGSFYQGPTWLVKTADGWDTTIVAADAVYEDVDAATVALANGTSALVVVSGSSQMPAQSLQQRDRIYVKKGQAGTVLSEHGTNASCVATLDMNGDGIEDLFIGERAVWDDYGAAPDHGFYLGQADGSFAWHPVENRSWTSTLGMVVDATAADLDGDGKKELYVASDWGPVYRVRFTGQNADETAVEAITETGLWRYLAAVDLNSDGQLDLLAGGFGENHGIGLSAAAPLTLWIKDLDGNGDRDFVYGYYNQGSQYPLFGRDELIKESVKYRKEYLKNRDFSGKTITELFGNSLDDAQKLEVGTTGSLALINSEGALRAYKLPAGAQLGPIKAALETDTGVLLGGGSDAVNTALGTQESYCGGMLIWDGETLQHRTKGVPVLRGSVATFVRTSHGTIAIMNDGPVLLMP